MLNDAELNEFQDHQTDDEWQDVTYHSTADLLEACSECGTVRAKNSLALCPWCEDIYCCTEGVCSERHRSTAHPTVAFWSW